MVRALPSRRISNDPPPLSRGPPQPFSTASGGSRFRHSRHHRRRFSHLDRHHFLEKLAPSDSTAGNRRKNRNQTSGMDGCLDLRDRTGTKTGGKTSSARTFADRKGSTGKRRRRF